MNNEVITYSKEQIVQIFNLLNAVKLEGLTNAQIITNIAMILNQPQQPQEKANQVNQEVNQPEKV